MAFNSFSTTCWESLMNYSLLFYIMQYLKFQLIKKHTPFHIPPSCLLPPASMQSDSSSHGLCLICFSEIKYEIFIYLLTPFVSPANCR